MRSYSQLYGCHAATIQHNHMKEDSNWIYFDIPPFSINVKLNYFVEMQVVKQLLTDLAICSTRKLSTNQSNEISM